MFGRVVLTVFINLFAANTLDAAAPTMKIPPINAVVVDDMPLGGVSGTSAAPCVAIPAALSALYPSSVGVTCLCRVLSKSEDWLFDVDDDDDVTNTGATMTTIGS